ncbi:unnamed protein product [Dibothriocephalus latus]|uniref:Uncharacterized protein n=1 Tax=Dibothriocephalus latus TaxID=60516 RepID=A0A3P7KVU0_DIBLA|nr:unnamed protein product [Dibothriocephalus latus]
MTIHIHSSAIAVESSFGDSDKASLDGESRDLTVSSSVEQLLTILQKHAQFEAADLKMMECTMQKFNLHFADPESAGRQSTLADTVAVCITEFIYDPDSGMTFEA